ncbi:MAG: proline dehydrogenase family protein [Flavobacteriaceae bacterium]|nr:proline dehydrogenase family protein [Flavobacteriaceae bacterium]
MSIFENTKVAFKLKSNRELRRAHLLFEAVDKNWITDFGAWSLPWAIHIPGVKSIIKNTVFAQFCGGESREESLETIDKLYEQNVKSILDYSVEGKNAEEDYDRCFNEIMQVIEIAQNNPKIPFVVFKPTGFGDMEIYSKIDSKEKLSADEQTSWNKIKERYDAVCKKSFEKNVTIMVDAEHSWMQNSVDQLVEEMMRKYNKNRCVVVHTIQMYRHDRLQYLKDIFKNALEENYFIGFKVVRGAYMEIERERAAEKGYASPIQPDKESTDKDYDAAVEFIIQHNDRISLFAGTHNEKSCQLLMEGLNRLNLTRDYHKIWFGQLLGMSDNISFVLGDLGYNVAKYVPYGPVKDVMPYLVRRAQENTSVAGQSSRELNLIEKELKRRKG